MTKRNYWTRNYWEIRQIAEFGHSSGLCYIQQGMSDDQFISIELTLGVSLIYRCILQIYLLLTLILNSVSIIYLYCYISCLETLLVPDRVCMTTFTWLDFRSRDMKVWYATWKRSTSSIHTSNAYKSSNFTIYVWY